MFRIMLLENNNDGRDFAVGDIHGSIDILNRKLKEVNFDPSKDRLISVGDIINKGINSNKAIKLLDEKWFYSVLGNHELMIIDYFLYGHYEEHLKKYNGKWFLEKNLYEREEIVEKLMKVPTAIELNINKNKIGIIHAEVPYDNWNTFKSEITGKYPERLVNFAVWNRDKIESQNKDKVKGIDAVYVGHSIVNNPVKLGNVFYIDTGAFYYGNMELVNLTEKHK